MLAAVFGDLRSEVLLAAAVLLLVYVLGKVVKWLKSKRLPPGPVGLPVVGYLPFIKEHPQFQFIKLAEKYGDVFSLYMGNQLVVVLNDGDSVREAFAKREFLGRPLVILLSHLGVDSPFFSPNIQMWQEQRKLVVQMMKDLGLGKSKIEGHIQEEIQYFMKVLEEETKGKPVDVQKILTPSMSNNICSLVFGERYEYEDPTRILMDDALENFGQVISQTAVFLFFPWIMKIPLLTRFFDYDKGIEAVQNVLGFIQKKVTHHKQTLDPENIRDYIDGYLVEMENRISKDPKTTFSEKTLKGTALNFFGAGSETVRTSVSWCIYVMAAFPDVQKKVQKEIADVLGSGRFPQITDQKDMPYTQAVIREVSRWQTTVPLNVARCTLDDTNVSGYFVPKGTVVIANLWSIHHHPKHWENPEEFNPQRFLNPDGTLKKSDYFMPFSVGKRSCPGETMAVMEIFLYFVAILQKFHVCFPEGYKPTYDAESGISYRLKPFSVCFKTK